MHDIEAQISRISGQQNYMDQLQRITGNINHIDMKMYHEKHTKIVSCDENIKKILRKMCDEDDTIENLKNKYEKESNSLNIKDKTFSMYQKKSKKAKKPKPPREIITEGYKPPELIKTEWFKLIKHIEKDINKFLIEVFSQHENDKDTHNKSLESKTFTDLEKEYREHPELLDIKTALNCKINSNSMFTSILLLKRFCKIIINILLAPMYDVKGTINSHWSEINRIFKTKAFQQTKIASPEDIVNILHQFIIAKYRSTITGNNKHYVKLFLDTIGNDNVSNLDGARFMEIMDSIDLDKLNKKDKVYKFALSAKSAMQRIANNETITPEVLKEFDEMFNDDEKDTNDDMNIPESNFSEHANILE